MEKINGITFAPFAHRGTITGKEVFDSLEKMVQRTGANWVIFAPHGVQEKAYSEEIRFVGEECATDEEWLALIAHAKKLGLKIAIKPTVNCLDGTWRAHISFFEKDVHCEPKWSNWFASYTAFQLHFAAMAEQTGCDMFIAGCEMVQTEHRAAEWRAVLAAIRTVYTGTLSYNTDKYQEECVTWWDAVDVISSSGYYPIHDWEQELDRIEAVVKQFDKPFFFAEAGCMSVEGSWLVPNDWGFTGAPNQAQQADWYQAMFTACAKRSWVGGFGLWAWRGHLYPEREVAQEIGYDLYGKQAECVVKTNYTGGV